MRIRKSSAVNSSVTSTSTKATNKYDKCLACIKSAISCLTNCEDVDADDREAIANLGVVALDISNKKKSCCAD